MIPSSREKEERTNFLHGFLRIDERFHYLQISMQIVTIVSLICGTSEIVFGCWSLNILSTKTHTGMEISSSKSKNVALGVAIVLILSTRITALIIWIKSANSENLRCYSVTSHCIFVSVFVMMGLGGLVIYFLSMSLESAGTFRSNTQVLLAFTYIAGFDILFTSTFGLAVVKDLQCKIRREWECGAVSRENWVVPSKWREAIPVHEVYV